MNNLLEYLYGTLTTDNMRWVGEHLIAYAEKEEALKPYTMDEINAMLDEAEADIAAGRVVDDDEVWREYDEERAREKRLEMAEAV